MTDYKPDVFEDAEKRDLAELLGAVEPFLLALWVEWLLPLEHYARVERCRLNEIRTSRQKMTGVLKFSEGSGTERFWQWCQSMATTLSRYKVVRGGKQRDMLFSKGGIKVLSIGLSFMQFIAISSEILGVDLQNIEGNQCFLLLLSALAAISLTFGAKEAISRWVKARGMLNERVPVFLTLLKGDGLAWCCLVLVIGEACFAAPGLLSLLSPRLASQTTFQVSAFCTAGLAAFVNVALAYSVALEELKFVSQIISREDEPGSVAQALELQPWVVDRVGKSYNREVREQERTVFRAENAARKARERWMRQVRRCLRGKLAQDYLAMKREERSREVRQGAFGKG